MNRQVNVRAIEELQEFREELAAFYDRCHKVLDTVLATCRQVEGEIDEHARYWQMMRKRFEDEVALARTELNRIRIATPRGHTPKDTDAKLALNRARRRLEHCEEALNELSSLKQQVAAIAEDLRKGISPLALRVASGEKAAVAKLEEIIRRLEAYLAVQPPVARAEDAEENQTERDHGKSSS